MSNKRTDIIIKEIHYWKEHNLLPKVYCNFLLALYTKGQSTDDQERAQLHGKSHYSSLVQISIVAMTLVLSLIVVYSKHIQPFVQLLLLIILILLCFWMYILLKNNNDIYKNLSLVSLLIIFLNVSIYITKYFFNFPWIINVIILVNFSIWFFVSQRNQLKFLRYASLTGLLATIGYLSWQLFTS